MQNANRNGPSPRRHVLRPQDVQCLRSANEQSVKRASATELDVRNSVACSDLTRVRDVEGVTGDRYRAAAPTSLVRMRMTSLSSDTKIFPSPT